METGERKMAREVVAPKVQLPANFVERLTRGIAESRASTVIAAGGKPIMRLLKDGDWVFGQSNEEVQEGSAWAINVATIEHGYVCWIDGALRGEIMTSVFHAKPERPPPIEGTPYKEQRSFDMKCVDGDDAGTEVIYKTSSISGMAASDKLFGALQARAAEDQTFIFPVVTLDTDYYQHKKHGKIYTPVLNIVGWVDQNGDAPNKANGGGAAVRQTLTAENYEEEAAPAPRTRTRKAPIGTTSVEAPQTTQQAHATAPVRRRPGR
jgi:hypothetical protein